MSQQNEITLEPKSSGESACNESGQYQEQKNTAETTENHKLIEAKTAVILLTDSRLSTKNEYTQWLLKILYQPYMRKEYEAMNVLYLSRNRRKIWATDFSINQETSIKKNMNQLYVITPRTSIMTISQENRFVYIIDLSSSLSTVGNTRADILVSKVFQTLKVSLESLVQPFSMQVSPSQKVVVEPIIRLTVMADCSQFASNVNVIQMLVDHPTMSVFIQNVVITVNNIHSIIKKLHTEFLNFQEATVQFRKFIKNKRENMGYNLDVGSEVAPPGGVGVLDATSSLTQTLKKSFSVDSIYKEEDNQSEVNRSNSEFDLSSKGKESSFYSSKKEVWGIGKSGANLSRILHAGHFALNLLPNQGRAQLVLITDGAMKSNVHDNTFVRQFAEQDITCHVIQIGYSSGFIPGRNFGFVPDTEILQFLSRATNGSFMYSDACTPRLPDDVALFNAADVPSPSVTSAEPLHRTEFPIVQFVDINRAKHIKTPNIFHRQFLFREVILTRQHHSELRLQADGDSQGRRELSGGNLMEGDLLRDRFNFPWDPYAKAPEGDWRLLKYREYILPSEFSHIIAARAREGFSVQSVAFDNGTGSKHLDSGIHDLEASDLTSVRKERIQIVMTMRWQPNIIIEYRIKATWLPTIIGNGAKSLSSQDILMSCNIFSRGKAPRAEIFVRTDTGFAHMLQNWDMLKRRAQMMGVVTGSIYFGEAYAAPVYSKIEKLKTYLVDIYESDEVLRTIIGFPTKFWLNASSGAESSAPASVSSNQPDSRSTSSNLTRSSIVQQMTSYIEAFKKIWERINNSEARARTRCWYDPGCIDLLVGDVSPFMTPKLSSTYNEEFVLNIEEDILLMLNHVKDVVREWSDFEAADGTFVRIVHKLSSMSAVNNEELKDLFTPSLGYPPSFCELRVRHEYGRLITLRLLFFNVEVLGRQKIIEHIIHSLKVNKYTKASCNMICERPFSRMLMRDSVHFTDITATGSNNEVSVRPAGNLTKNQSRAKAWYLPVAMWLTSEYIVRDYLKHMTWSWQTDSHQDVYHKENKMMPIHDLAFQFLCQVRLDQGYRLVSPRQDSAQFYQEINIIDHEKKSLGLCAVQYFVWKDSDTGKITTEIWMEPSSDFGDRFGMIKKWTFEPDRKTISQLVTFDQIHTIGRQKGVGDFKDKKKGEPEALNVDSSIMLLPQLFDVASVLRSNKFVVSSFRTPEYNMELLPHSKQHVKLKSLSNHVEEQDTSDHSGNSTPIIRTRPAYNAKVHRHVRRHAHPVIIDNDSSSTLALNNHQKLFSFRPDSLLSKNKETIAKLDVILQNFALLHYFVERSLSYISSGEILMSHHDVGTAFWLELRNALQSATKGCSVSSTSLIPDLRKTRCFVKIFDPRTFVVILCPSLESVSSGLLKLQEEDKLKSISTIEQCQLLDIFMFECVRQKPIRPTKTENLYADSETNTLLVENMIEAPDTITIKPIEYLIHESDGLGLMLRPTLFKGQYSSCQEHAQLTDRVLRVAQDVSRYYSRSFYKSFYACLMRGFMMDDDDLSKVLEVCNESLMEIDITEFVNTMTMQKQECSESNEIQELEIQAKFNAIFHQYFELLQTKNKSVSNLFYYKPPFIRSDYSDPRQENMSQDDRISFIVDLVAHAEAPLLLRLNVAYKTGAFEPGASDNEFIAPVTSLPTSNSWQSASGEKYGFEESDMNAETFPVGSSNKKVYLQIVCLNMTRSYMDVYNLPDNMFPYVENSNLQSMQMQPEWFSSLNQHQKVALAETECRLIWLLKEETIHGLLKTPVISLPILQYVESQLSVPCPLVDYETSIKLPFQFVRNNRESRRIFMSELEKDSCCRTTSKYLLKRVGDYFYVSEDSVFNMGEEASYSNSGSPVVTESARSVIDNDRDMVSHPTDDDFCDGLGISLSKLSEREEIVSSDDSSKSDVSTPLDKRPLYWLLLIPYDHYVQVYFCSKFSIAGSRLDILNPIKEKIKLIEERTNRLALLNYLQEARICSKYLEAPSDPNAIYSEEEESGEDTPSEEIQDVFNTSKESSKFSLGQFACPLVFTRRFPLHWRLQPNVSLKFLTSDVLRLFTVTNRPNMFVIERDSSIIYCKIYEENLDLGYEGSPITMYGSPVHTLNDRNMDDDQQTLIADTPRRDIAKSAASPRPRMASGGRMTANEKRELVLEVYGVDLPDWVEVEFVNMIENRLVSQITLNEIQQFFARNSTSKPTAADVEFILPVHKPVTQREMLRVPSLVNSPYKLMQFFKSSLIADNIKPLSGPYVRQAISNYYDNIFFMQERDAIQDGLKRQVSSSETQPSYDIPPGSFCFYYNCLKRLPGISTPLELSAGQGMAGICLTLLDDAGVPLSRVQEDSICGKNFDPEVIHHCLEEEFREAKEGSTFFHIWVDVWVIGAVDSNALVQHIYECYRQSLCDYFIEKTVTIDLGAALSMDGALQRAVTSKRSEGRLGTVVRKKFIESVLFILKKASELKSPTVCSMDKAIQSNPWCMDDLIRYLDIELRKVDTSLRPTVAWTSLGDDIWAEEDDMYNTGSKWELYRGFQYRQRQKLQSNIRLVAISGLDEFVEKLGSVSDALASERRLSTNSDNDSQRARSRRSSGESANTEGGSSQKKLRAEDQSRGSSTLSNSGFLNRNGPKLDSQKHCFLLMTLDVHRLSVYTYNWSEAISQELFNGLNRVIIRQEARNDIMTNILHQKMGLFHHTQSIKSVMERFSLTNDVIEVKPSSGNASAGTTFSVPNHHSSPTKAKSKPNNRQYDIKPDATPSIRTPGSTKKVNNSANTSSYPMTSMLDLKDMIAFPTTVPSREKTDTAGDEKEKQIERILQKTTIRTTELDQALMDSSTDSVADTVRSKDFDILRRHGQPFLEAFLRRTKVHSAHRKALKVYLKWRKRYGQTGMDCAERLTRPEVATIMRSSRVLHFCRTPLIFCDPEKDWSHLPEDSSARAIVVDWFKDMANALLSEYATYLEGADMQLIDFAKCDNDNTNNNNDASLLRKSKFSLGKKVSADCLPTFLLRVFEGGSIICEVRLTKVFVSVTLYTLHRQYGRLDYNRFRPETRGKKRKNFKKFEENSGHFKQMIHINSFVYDFQLHYIQKMLGQKVPAELDLLAFIQRFAMTNQQPSPYSKNRILHGFYQADSLDSSSFFDNLFKNAQRYGLQHVLSESGYSAVTVTGSDVSFDGNSQQDSRWKYTLVMCPIHDQDQNIHQIMIEYFVIVVCQEQTTPETMTRTSWVKSETNKVFDLKDISLPEEGYTIADIVSGARKRLDSIVSEVIVSCKRIRNWSMIYSTTTSNASPDLIQMIGEFGRIDIREVDKNVAKVLDMRLDWNAALDLIKTIKKGSIRDFHENEHRHLLIYNSRYMDFMIHLRVSPDQGVGGWMVSREKRTNRTAFEAAEREQLVSLSKILYYYIWRVISGKTT